MQVHESPSWLTVEEFGLMFRDIYHDLNNLRYDNSTLLLRLFEQCSKMHEVVRKDYRDQFASQLADIYSFLNGVANRFNINLQEALWLKYPGICTYCLQKSDCECGMEHDEKAPKITESERLLIIKQAQQDRVDEPKNLADHQQLHYKLYFWKVKVSDPSKLADHITEEAGEVSRECRHGRLERGAEEMADVISWIFALSNRLKINLSDEIWKFYPYKCRDCYSCPCICRKEKNS